MKWGILATGNIAGKFAETVGKMEQEEQIVAVGSRSPERGKEFAETYGIPTYYASYEELLADSQLEAVYVATPNRLHFEDCKRCLEAGKHVLCEKPLTTRAEDSEELYRLAEEKGLFLMEALWIRFLPLYEKLKTLLAEGAIGEIQSVECQYGFEASGIRRTRKLMPELGGGALMDIGIYNLGFIQMVLGMDPERFETEMEMNEFGTDDYSSLTLHYPGNITVHSVQATDRVMERTAVIRGTKGSIFLPDFQHAVSMTVRPLNGEACEMEFPVEINGFEYEIRETSRLAAAGETKSCIHSPKDSVALMRLMDDIRQVWREKYGKKGYKG